MCMRDVQMGWTGYVHVAAIRMMGIVNAIQLVNESCKCLCKPDGLGEEAPPQSLSFCHHAPEALARWQ